MARPDVRQSTPQETIRLLQQELADTNGEVLALTLELDKRMEQLRAAEQRFRRLAENAPDVILRYEISPKRVCSFANPRITELTGYLPEEFCADSELGLQVVHPDDRAAVEALFRGEGPDVGLSVVRWIGKSGATVWIEQHHVMVREQGKLVAIECVARDITARKQLEEQLLQAQKMEAVGHLAGGVAHDFNNLLTVINGCSFLALESLKESDPVREEIQEIYRAGERAASLTRQLLAFSRRQVLAPRVLDMNAIVSDMERMLRRVLGGDIELASNLEPGLESIFADPGQVEQVILNLAVNARDAMAEGGRLLIETFNVVLDRDYTERHNGVTPGPYVMLAVSDTGCGMDQQTQARIFEPFFTTKAPGHGTGLGLSTVFGIVQQSGGTIWVYSEPGKGTTFKIYFPSVGNRKQQAEATPVVRPSTGSETILVVEDDQSVRGLIRSALKRAGYSVLEARNGAEALQLYESRGADVDLILTDIVMPQMSGPELANRFAAVRPDVRILFMSGNTARAVALDGVLDSKAPFLPKPFSPAGLTAKIREVLDTAT
jgi:two-component system cell cycle sensor histidine kinase/response regulator CckA